MTLKGDDYGRWIRTIYQPNYVMDENEFCRQELDEFYLHDSEEWRDAHRQAVLDKREQFRLMVDSELSTANGQVGLSTKLIIQTGE